MQFKKIVGFGDSWMYGDELLDPELLKKDPTAHTCFDQNTEYRERNCFLGLLGKHYGVPTENFGIPGGSFQSSIWTFLWWLEHEQLDLNDCLVLVAHTNSNRVSHYNPHHVHYSNDPPWNKFVHSAWVNFGSSVIEEEFATMIKQQLVLTDCPALNRLNYQQTVMTFDGTAARQNLNLLQFHVMPGECPMPQCPTLIWPDWALVPWFLHDPENRDRRYYKQHGHPNESGHRKIADRLISHIDMC